MKTQQDLYRQLVLTTAALVLALASMVLVAPGTRADVLSDYHPQVLSEAGRALESGRPERALSLLHRQRAILRHEKFLGQRNALTCQAYFQKQQFLKAERACAEALAQGHSAAKLPQLYTRR